MPCGSSPCLAAARPCKEEALVAPFSRIPDDRLRIQLQVMNILTHDPDGKEIDATEAERNAALEDVANRFPRSWDRGMRCPRRIADAISWEMAAAAHPRILCCE